MFLKGFMTILLLVISNTFMTFAWYGHLKWLNKSGIAAVIVISWGIAFFEYCFQVPANRIGFGEGTGPFSLIQLKIIQEAITLTVFTVFSFFAFNDRVTHNHLIGFFFMILAVYFIFRK